MGAPFPIMQILKNSVVGAEDVNIPRMLHVQNGVSGLKRSCVGASRQAYDKRKRNPSHLARPSSSSFFFDCSCWTSLLRKPHPQNSF